MRAVLYFSLLMIAGNAFALEIDKAYQLIPHRQTPFVLHQSNIPTGEATKLARLLSLAELAMVERVGAMVNGPVENGYFNRIDDILWQLKMLDTPQNLRQAHLHIMQAVTQHRSFFELYKVDGNKAESERGKLIQGSHRQLIMAYQILMNLYPQETSQNRQAFFDYLCALDFI